MTAIKHLSRRPLSMAAVLIGNLLEHYDTALYSFFMPFIAVQFFPTDEVRALIYAYAALPLGLLSRPLGALVWGRLGDRIGRKRVLIFTLCGMAAVTVGMGCLPTYRQVGVLSPILLVLCRTLQSFLASGESTGGALFILEQTDEKKRTLMSSIFDASTLAGIILASFGVGLATMGGAVENRWRLLFFLGGCTGIIGVFLRLKAAESSVVLERLHAEPKASYRVLWEMRAPLLAVALVSGFSQITYEFAFTFFNGFLPFVSSHHAHQIVWSQNALLAADMILLPLFGYLATKRRKERVMQVAALCLALGALPLFGSIQGASLGMIVLLRGFVVGCGACFAAPYHHWSQEMLPMAHRFTVLSFAKAIGSQLLGAPTASVCLWLYYKTGWKMAPAFYLLATALAAAAVVMVRPRSRELAEASESHLPAPAAPPAG